MCRNKNISSVLYGWNSVSIHIFFSRCTQYFLKGYIKIYELQMYMKPLSFYLMFSRKYSLSFYYGILEQKKIKPGLKCMNRGKYKFLTEMPRKMSKIFWHSAYISWCMKHTTYPDWVSLPIFFNHHFYNSISTSNTLHIIFYVSISHCFGKLFLLCCILICNQIRKCQYGILKSWHGKVKVTFPTVIYVKNTNIFGKSFYRLSWC